jgi:hypothetical protein
MKPSDSIESPARRLAGFIATFDPEIRSLVRSARSALRRRLPTAIELVYDSYNALVIGFAATERASDAIVSLAVYPKGLNLYFIYGATLPDPERLLHGSGNQGRFVRLANRAALDDPAVGALLKAAVREAMPPLPRAGRGHLVIKSVSARRRSRRPQ